MVIRRVCAFAVVAFACAMLQGCSLLMVSNGNLHPMTVMIPNAQGGGYDIAARTMTNVMENTGITGHIDVFNVVGDNETVAMARLMKESGNGQLMMMMGLGMVGACFNQHSVCTPSDATPLAELTEQPEIVVVPADSPYRTIAQLVAAWRSDPAAITVGGGSSIGGPNYVFPMELARAIGIAAADVRYRSFSGDGQLLPALLNHTVSFGASGMAEYRDQIAAGRLRVLALSSSAPSPHGSPPTLQQAGIDLSFENWHGVLAPPGLTPDARQRLISLLTRMHDTEQWQHALRANGWTDAFRTGDAFRKFLVQQEHAQAHIMRELGAPAAP